MKTVLIRCTLGIGYSQTQHVEQWEEEVPDNLSDDDLYEWMRKNIWNEWIWNFIEGGPEIIKK